MNHEINRLLHFAVEKQMITEDDLDYAANLLIDLLKEDEFIKESIDEHLEECTPILEKILDLACDKGLIENNITMRDLFDTRIMNCLMPRPSEVINTFHAYYKEKGPQAATEYFYQLSIASNYIRKSRVDKNIKWESESAYGNIQISINLSKPEKDPKEIEKAKLVKATDYPKCLLCKENVGYAGDLKKPARQNHRIIPFELDGSQYFLQYSPYVYYNEHCIVFNEKHIPMKINRDTFTHLLSFIDKLPHYFIGSNADLPIVGGSILSHDHFQGGCHHFPIEKANVIESYKLNQYPDIQLDLVEWPLSTLRLTSLSKQQIIDLAEHILKTWQHYDDPTVDIIAYTHQTPHNTITPIARKVNNQYQLDLVLRNNRRSETYPDGIFHPHQDVHHIKKENIGLIEVMGLAILPARLKEEMSSIAQVLLGSKDESDPKIQKHLEWIRQIKDKHIYNEENVMHYLQQEVGEVFVRVLEDAGVFKMNERGIEAFKKFVSTLDK